MFGMGNNGRREAFLDSAGDNYAILQLRDIEETRMERFSSLRMLERMDMDCLLYTSFPYVWGGSSPSTSFDCSGFVCWVINNCGNGWNVGRTTANGLRSSCDIIPASEAQPGDLIFFQGTYDTAGASHVGIYVGGGMMIHCGNPISYASIEISYWQSHFYAYGRIL